MLSSLLPIDWPRPQSVHCASTTRLGGFSSAHWQSFNLSDQVGDDIQSVAKNRHHLKQIAALPSEPFWLKQLHSTRISLNNERCADARFSQKTGEVCVVLTADCLPVLICDQQGTAVAAVHAGWRGLAAGIIEHCLAYFNAPVSVWLGPAIGPDHFEVGDEVYHQFVQSQYSARSAFVRLKGRYLADLYELARLRLDRAGVNQIYGGHYCTYAQSDLFYSYRRQSKTGRMAHLIWLQK